MLYNGFSLLTLFEIAKSINGVTLTVSESLLFEKSESNPVPLTLILFKILVFDFATFPTRVIETFSPLVSVLPFIVSTLSDIA